MQITVTKIYTKDGTNKKGAWKLTKWTDENDEQYGTFDKKARSVNVGDVVEISFSNDGEGNNVDSWELVSKASPEEAAAASVTGAESDNQKRPSIERQSSAATLLQYAATVQAAGGGVGANEQAAVNKAIAWLSSRFDETPQTSEQEWAKLQSAGTPKDMGELLTWCLSEGISRAKFMEIGKIDEEGMKKVNIEEAYLVVKDYLHEHKGG